MKCDMRCLKEGRDVCCQGCGKIRKGLFAIGEMKRRFTNDEYEWIWKQWNIEGDGFLTSTGCVLGDKKPEFCENWLCYTKD